MKSNENKWELLRENIQVKKVIGKGSFGQVAKGILLTETKKGKLTEQVVAIKMTKGQWRKTQHLFSVPIRWLI